MELEHACWVDWKAGTIPAFSARRAYLGHETCQSLLPTVRAARAMTGQLADRGISITFVTPFLTDEGLKHAHRLIEAMLRISPQLEVVCSDWGLLHDLSRLKVCEPVIGRLLAAQAADPRIARMLTRENGEDPGRTITHLDGAQCCLRRTPPSPTLASHLRSCWLDKASVIELMKTRGIHRCEISNIAQGIELAETPGWSYSLHVPNVLVSVMRTCPGPAEDFNRPRCGSRRCRHDDVEWKTSLLPMKMFRRHNALYYEWPTLPQNLAALPIDRVVAGSCA